MTDADRAADLPDPVDLLVETCARTVPDWLAGCVVRTAEEVFGQCPEELAERARELAEEQGPVVVARLVTLVRTDVDEQRSNPLAVLREATRHPTEVLRAGGVPPRRRDEFAVERFPDDVYDLAPATWSDVHPDLHEAGILWGAWKAATVLQRRRVEGRR